MTQQRIRPQRISPQRIKWTLWGILATLSLVFFQSACSPAQQPATEEPDLVRIGMIRLGRWPTQIAKDQGFFARENLNVEFVFTGHFQPLVDGIAAGEIDIGHQAASHPIRLKEEGVADVVIFQGERMGASNNIITKPEIKTYEGLKGKRVGCSGRGGQDCLFLRKMMASNGLTEQDWELVYGYDPTARYVALKAGEIDGTIMGSPGRAVEEGFTHLDGVAKYIEGPFQFSVAMASRSWAEENPDRLVRYIRAYVAALDWMSAPENREAAIEIIARIGEMDAERAASGLDGILRTNNPKAELSVEGLQAVIENMAEFDILPQPPPPMEKYVDLSYYNRAMEQ